MHRALYVTAILTGDSVLRLNLGYNNYKKKKSRSVRKHFGDRAININILRCRCLFLFPLSPKLIGAGTTENRLKN